MQLECSTILEKSSCSYIELRCDFKVSSSILQNLQIIILTGECVECNKSVIFYTLKTIIHETTTIRT